MSSTPSLARDLEAGGGRADHQDGRRAGEGGEDRGVEPDRPAALHDHGVAERDLGPLDGVETRCRGRIRRP